MQYRQPPEPVVSAEPEDNEIIHWASANGLRYYYAAEPSLPDRCLKVHLGHITAYFQSGKLVRMWVQADGEYLDDVFYQLTQLFEICVQIDGYLDQQTIVSLPNRRALFTDSG